MNLANSSKNILISIEMFFCLKILCIITVNPLIFSLNVYRQFMMDEAITEKQSLNSSAQKEELAFHKGLIDSAIRKALKLFSFKKDEREDLEQETWVKILTEQVKQKIPNFSEEELLNYIKSIARNKAIDLKRRQQFENKIFESKVENTEDLYLDSRDSFSEVEHFFQAVKIWGVLKKNLSHKQKFVILLEDSSCISYLIRHKICTFNDIARELQLPVEVLKQVYIKMDEVPNGYYSNQQLGVIFENNFKEKMTAEQVSNLRNKAYSKLRNCRND